MILGLCKHALIVFFIFALIDGVVFHPRFILLIYPIITLVLFDVGVGLVLILDLLWYGRLYLHGIYIWRVRYLLSLYILYVKVKSDYYN